LDEILDIKLAGFSEKPGEPGYMFSDFQVLIRNVSTDQRINFFRSPNYNSSTTKAEGV
jgi:hypothetical protein